MPKYIKPLVETENGLIIDENFIPKTIARTSDIPDSYTKEETDTHIEAKVTEQLTAAKESGEFDGEDGKSAYEYAKGGGYTGTEEEFATKLAAEYITSESDPTVPAWAKAATKPSYTASEVGAYTKTEIDNLELITVADIDAICGATIQVATASEVTF